MAQELDAMLPALLDVLGHVGTGVMVVCDRGTALERLYSNSTAAARLGYSVDELQALPVIETIAPKHRAVMGQLLASFRAGQPVPPALELTLMRKDRTTMPTELALGAFDVPGGVACVIVMRDVSVHEQAHLSLLEADRIGLVGALSAGFAHEINNPLTYVLLNLRSLRRQLAVLSGGAQAQAMRCLDEITIGAERIAGNVKALQTLVARGPTAAIDLASVVSAALRLATPTLETRAHVIRKIFPVQRVLGEESRIGQAVLAMLLFSSSGFDAEITSANNRITISVEQRGGDAVLEVSDNGRDLTADEARQAFDPFFRSPARGAGVGVGLGVARSVAAALGGEVTLAPRLGGGAVITMRLPTTAES